MKPRLEHGNLTVRDVDAIVGFVQTAFPEFRIRGEGKTTDGRRWVHVGTDEYYLALDQAKPGASPQRAPYDGQLGINHLGWVVQDVAGIRDRLRAAGYRDTTFPNTHPHRTRVYFNDSEGNDWEFVEYHSDDPAARNDYTLPG